MQKRNVDLDHQNAFYILFYSCVDSQFHNLCLVEVRVIFEIVLTHYCLSLRLIVMAPFLRRYSTNGLNLPGRV